MRQFHIFHSFSPHLEHLIFLRGFLGIYVHPCQFSGCFLFYLVSKVASHWGPTFWLASFLINHCVAYFGLLGIVLSIHFYAFSTPTTSLCGQLKSTGTLQFFLSLRSLTTTYCLSFTSIVHHHGCLHLLDRSNLTWMFCSFP